MLRDAHAMSGVLWREKPPLENEIVHTYPARDPVPAPTSCDRQAQGADGLPTTISRTLDDGTTQTSRFAYTERGAVTNLVDPAGRAFSFAYASNGIDLLEVFNDNTRERLARFTYNDQHLPLTVTDAAGHTTTFTYNPQGQLLTVTNAKEETTTFTYDAQGYLTTVTGARARGGHPLHLRRLRACAHRHRLGGLPADLCLRRARSLDQDHLP